MASAAQALKSFLIKSQQEASSVLNGEDAKVNIRKKYKSHDQTNDYTQAAEAWVAKERQGRRS